MANKMSTIEVHEWTCKKCGKKIVSMYERQFDQHKEIHLESHKKEEKK